MSPGQELPKALLCHTKSHIWVARHLITQPHISWSRNLWIRLDSKWPRHMSFQWEEVWTLRIAANFLQIIQNIWPDLIKGAKKDTFWNIFKRKTQTPQTFWSINLAFLNCFCFSLCHPRMYLYIMKCIIKKERKHIPRWSATNSSVNSLNTIFKHVRPNVTDRRSPNNYGLKSDS